MIRLLLLLAFSSLSFMLNAQTKADLVGDWEIVQSSFNKTILDGSKMQNEQAIGIEIAINNSVFHLEENGAASFDTFSLEYKFDAAAWVYDEAKRVITISKGSEMLMALKVQKADNGTFIFTMIDDGFEMLKFNMKKVYSK